MRNSTRLACNLATAISLAVANDTFAQHRDVLLQSDGTKIVVGAADFTGLSWTIGTRVFARDFDSDYRIDNPGFNALSHSSPFLPPGYFALPPSSPVGWDFLPMTIGDTVANLMYWNGQDTNANGVDSTDVAFGVLPAASLSLAGVGGTVAADGSSEQIVGPTLLSTDGNGAVHTHREYELFDGDMNPGTSPADGIYLVAMQVRMAALETSAPIYLVFGPPSAGYLAARNAAVEWVTGRVDSLVVALPGDYNGDDVVDGLDYAVWRNSFGQQVKLPNEAASPNLVDNADFDVWKLHYGEVANPGTGGGQLGVPEPTAANSSLGATIICLSRAWRRRHRALGSTPPPR